MPAAAETPEEYLEKITKTDQATRQVVMTLDWKPSEQFKAKIMRAGMRPDALTDEILAKFQIHYNGESKPQNKWESALVTWCKRERANPQQPQASPNHPEKKPEPNYPIGTLVLAPGHTLPPIRPKTPESIARGTAQATAFLDVMMLASTHDGASMSPSTITNSLWGIRLLLEQASAAVGEV